MAVDGNVPSTAINYTQERRDDIYYEKIYLIRYVVDIYIESKSIRQYDYQLQSELEIDERGYLFRHKLDNKLDSYHKYYEFYHPVHPYKQRLNAISP